MLIETGHFALILALFTALAQASLPLIGAARGNADWMNTGKLAARAQFALIAVAFLALMHAYVTSDFSVLNVAQNSHTDKPLLYKITGVWGNHEGSMLLWIFILALYGFALSFSKTEVASEYKEPPPRLRGGRKNLGLASAKPLVFAGGANSASPPLTPLPLRCSAASQDWVPDPVKPWRSRAASGRGISLALQARALAAQGIVSFGFLLYILFASNPFLRLDPPPLNGEGLNPLLQDPGLAFHPPFLYLGYVGFSMSFSFAIAALIEGRVDAAWARWLRPWTLAAWSFLTLGIAMGSWWAYYTLGWGGWWYWDPVENASFIPWLAGTALVHSIVTVEKRGALKTWTLLLAIITFSFSLIGTFLVRSGVLTSVHSFASDPKRGVFILALLTVLSGGALILFFLRAPKIKSGGMFAPVSREGALLLNNMLLSTAAGSVLLGTLYPIFIEALNLGKISVGPPFFNIVFVPLMVPLIVIMAIGPLLAWKRGDLPGVLQRLKFAAMAAVIVIAATWLIAGGSPRALAAACGFGLAAWLFAGTLTPVFESLRAGRQFPRNAWGMTLAHAGLAIVLAGVTGSLAFKAEKIQVMHPGESVDVAGITMTFNGVEENMPGPNYTARRANFTAAKNGALVAVMQPEHRVFTNPPQPVTSAAIHTNLVSDLYAVIGEPDGAGGYVTRFYKNPLVPWIFLGAVVIALGGFVSLMDRRRAHAYQESGGIPLPRSAGEGLGAGEWMQRESSFADTNNNPSPAKTKALLRKAKFLLPPAFAKATAGTCTLGRRSLWRRRLPQGERNFFTLLLPLTAFAILAGFFISRLALIENGEAPNLIPSVLINKPAPAFDLPPLLAGTPGLKTADLKGKVTLVNFFASWCVPCQAEHPVLLSLQGTNGLTLAGIDYEDKPDAAQNWLKKAGNPFAALGSDRDGKTGIDFGLTGVPESYLIDKQGIIRFKQTGVLTPEIVQEKILPLAAELNK